MSEITHFIAIPIDLTNEGLVAVEPFKCASPASAIDRAKSMWKVFGHSSGIRSHRLPRKQNDRA
jgi:hypothetical protein